jgi:hypothetical protein
MTASSTSSTELLAPGARVAGYRVEGVLGRGSHGVVYEATQLDLDRPVALRIVARAAGPPRPWPDGPHVVALYASGDCEQGRYMAMRLVRGTSLAELAASGGLRGGQARELLAQVADALGSAHAAGIVHGSLNARNVLVDSAGQALVSDFGLEPGSIEADREALAALGERYGASPAAPAHHRLRLLVPLALLAAAGGVLALVLGGKGQTPLPAPPPGSVVLGSSLTGGGVRSVDCEGGAPNGSSLGCTLLQTRLPGRGLVAPRDGVIRHWTVRGAKGQLALQVLRGDGSGAFEVVAASPYVVVPDRRVHGFETRLPIRAGERVAVEVTPEASIGVRGDPGALTWRFVGPLRESFRAPARRSGSGFDYEVLLRVDYAPS